MAGYLVPPTKNPGDVLTSSLWNSYIRDNLDFGMVRPIADQVLGIAAASIDFTSIPATFAHLMVEIYAAGDTAAPSISVLARLNNDSSAIYSGETFSAVHATLVGLGYLNAAQLTIAAMPAATGPGVNHRGAALLFIPNYAQPSGNKSVLGFSYYENADTVAGQGLYHVGGIWKSAAAINRLTLLPGAGNFVASSRATLYGMGGI